MTKQINGKRIAILSTDGYEQVELTDPKKNLEKAGTTVDVISIKKGEIKGWNHTDWGKSVNVDHLVNEVKSAANPKTSPPSATNSSKPWLKPVSRVYT